MRIAHVISTPEGVGGAERILASLLRYGSARGWDQYVLNPFGQEDDGGELGALCRTADPNVAFDARRCSSPVELPGTRRWLARRLREANPDVVHAHLFHAMVMCGTLTRRISAPTVLTHHHGDHNLAEGRRVRTALDRVYGRRFDSVVAISEWVRRLLESELSIPRDKISVIRNGWSGEPIVPVAHQDPTIVCVARLREQKGHEDLLRAFRIVLGEMPDARLRLVGDGPLLETLRETVGQLGLERSVTFEGSVTEVWPFLAQADLFVLASHYEPLGLAVLEAMAAGVPVVATAAGGIPELITDEVTGRLTSPGDHEALAGAILETLRSPRRFEIAEKARSVAASMTAEAMAEGYHSLYRRIGAFSRS